MILWKICQWPTPVGCERVKVTSMIVSDCVWLSRFDYGSLWLVVCRKPGLLMSPLCNFCSIPTPSLHCPQCYRVPGFCPCPCCQITGSHCPPPLFPRSDLILFKICPGLLSCLNVWWFTCFDWLLLLVSIENRLSLQCVQVCWLLMSIICWFWLHGSFVFWVGKTSSTWLVSWQLSIYYCQVSGFGSDPGFILAALGLCS